MPSPQIERVDAIPILIMWLQRMAVAEHIDSHWTPHREWDGLRSGQLAVIFLTFVLHERDHRRSALADWVAAHADPGRPREHHLLQCHPRPGRGRASRPRPPPVRPPQRSAPGSAPMQANPCDPRPRWGAVAPCHCGGQPRRRPALRADMAGSGRRARACPLLAGGRRQRSCAHDPCHACRR